MSGMASESKAPWSVYIHARLHPSEYLPLRPTRACSCGPSAATQRLQLSARAFHRVLKLAGAIVDLAESETIAAPHIAEALQYRPRVDVGEQAQDTERLTELLACHGGSLVIRQGAPAPVVLYLGQTTSRL